MKHDVDLCNSNAETEARTIERQALEIAENVRLLGRAYSYLSLIYYRHYRGGIPEDLRPELEALLNDLRHFGHSPPKNTVAWRR